MQLEVSLNYCSQNGGNVYRAPYYNRNPNIGSRIDSNLGQSPFGGCVWELLKTQALLRSAYKLTPILGPLISGINMHSAAG